MSEEQTEFSSEDEAADGTLDLSTLSDSVLWGTDWTVETIIAQLKRSNIELNPRFQRRDAWNRGTKSRFIESLVLGLPIPQVVLAEIKDQRGRYIILDGKQRLLTLMQFSGLSEDRNSGFSLSGQPLKQLPQTLKPPPKKRQNDWLELIKPDKRLSQSIAKYSYEISQRNNGIKEDSIISILLPIGFDPDLLDEVLISDLNDIGTKRGEAAHKSSAIQLRKGVNPSDEHEQVKRIVDGLRNVDNELDRILQAAR